MILSEDEALKLMNDLEVHQVILELKNEELKLAKRQVESQESQYVEFFDFTPTGYFMLSRTGIITGINHLGAKMVGREHSQLKNKRFINFVSHQAKPVFSHFLANMFNNRTPEICELTLTAESGLPNIVQLAGIVTESGEECLVTAIDITHRKHAEEALEKSQEWHRSIIQTAMDGFFVANRDGLLLEANESYCRMIGYTLEELLLMHISDLEADEAAEVTAAHIEYIMENGEDRFETRHRRKNATTVDVEINVQFKLIDGGRFIVFLHDITGRKKAEADILLKNEQLAKLNAEKDKFFSVIAHDLKNPFNSLLGLSRVMAEDLPSLSQDEIARIALALRKSAENYYGLLENLLEWTRMQRGMVHFIPEPFLLLPEIEIIMQLLSEPADKKGIEILINVPSAQLVFADIQIMRSLIRNLVFNAIKFTNRGGKITLKAIPVSGDLIEISISDTGIGMDKDLLSNLFLLDGQTGRKGTAGESGTGLGLIISKELIEKQGGNIWAESEEGKGSVFFFTVPACEKRQKHHETN
jgi:PAS domain S-box-containing protein